ncbi:DUF1194 domain-containing protein [Thalassotalea mangrovi]|uniref:DUF1194 domain-containing protein n=1 Tax=Thalassotalea mangrovi TaxID=2572245 RepID=A0A4U1B982_9GAMM|nr:DUF1194 domain-containing protein [Thalassotalea mangrovi]TKB47213.1 DUF1194 domain-containing protein [Thalassotalea mangrovi]
MLKHLLKYVFVVVFAIAGFQTKAMPISVDLELQLLVDVSGSVDNNEYLLQKQGYVDAFNDVNLWNAIEEGSIGAIAVQYIEWSGSTQQAVLVDWVLIDSFAAAQAFAAQIDATSRTYAGATAPGSAINFGVQEFTDNGFDGTRQVIDISGDGQQNDGANTAAARDAALLAGIDAINGIVISGDAGLEAWYNANVKGGTGSFVQPVSDFSDFGTAVENKLIREVSSVPEPTTMLMFIASILGFAGRRVFS